MSGARLNGGFAYVETVTARAEGTQLLDWLCAEYAHSTRDEWSERIVAGLVTLDGRAAQASDALHRGQALRWARPPWVEPDVPLTYGVVFEDEHLLIVDKPPGLPTMPAGGFLEHTLCHQVQRRDPKWSPVHRLGRGTSGLVVFSAPHASPQTNAAFRDREIEKRYLARVTGALEPQTITAPIGKVPHALVKELHAVTPNGRFAQTIVERVEGPLALVRIVTGRPHQIRIHLAHVGHPLEGDPLYGAHGVLLDALPGDCGYFLRAVELAFRHPVTGAPLRITAPPSSDARAQR